MLLLFFAISLLLPHMSKAETDHTGCVNCWKKIQIKKKPNDCSSITLLFADLLWAHRFVTSKAECEKVLWALCSLIVFGLGGILNKIQSSVWLGVCICGLRRHQQCENVARPRPVCLCCRSAGCPPHPPCEGMLQQRVLLINQPAHTYPAQHSALGLESHPPTFCQWVMPERSPGAVSQVFWVEGINKKIENCVWFFFLDKWGSGDSTSGAPTLWGARTYSLFGKMELWTLTSAHPLTCYFSLM